MNVSTLSLHTNDRIIRTALRKNLESLHEHDAHSKIFEEFGLTHGLVRADMVVVNGCIHGYELKSDLDTLQRLPEQMRVYNTVFDRMTLVVGKHHINEAIRLIPEWWGVTLAKISESNGAISLFELRESDVNPKKDSLAIARLLWRGEALNILEELGSAEGVRSKPREFVYKRLVEILQQEDLCDRVRNRLFERTGWR